MFYQECLFFSLFDDFPLLLIEKALYKSENNIVLFSLFLWLLIYHLMDDAKFTI